MADLPESATYPAGIYQLEQTDPVVGGPPNLSTGEGMSNVQAQQLADRTRWLKTELESRTAPAAILAGLKTVDGSGSGLDADLLDGRNLDQAATNLTVAQRSASGDLSARLFRSEFASESSISSGATIAMRVNASTDNYLRSITAAGFVAWLNANNSGLNADTIDGLQGSQLLRNDQNGTIGGDLTVAGGDMIVRGASATAGPILWLRDETSRNRGLLYWDHVRDEIELRRYAADGTTIQGVLEIDSGGTLKANGGTIWHSGNDGAGSTLDADLLDGLQGADYARFGTTSGNRDDYLLVNRSGANPALYVNNFSGGAIARFLSGNAKGDTAVAGANLDITAGGGIDASGTISTDGNLSASGHVTSGGKVVSGDDINVGGNQIVFTYPGAAYIESAAGNDLLFRIGSDLYAYLDVSDNSFRVARDYRLDGKSKVAIDLGNNSLLNVANIVFDGSTAGDYINYSTGQGLQVFENGVFKARIGPNSYFAETVDMNGGLNVTGAVNSDNNITAGGWFYQQGERMCSQRADYGIGATVFARKSAGSETLYGQTLPGSSLQVCNAFGGNNNGNIGVGTWRCLGYSAANASGSEASATLWTRIL